MHIVLLNPQGNFDNLDSYWTEHPDFGGQLVYVKELAKALASLGHKVDIVTRQIIDPAWPEFSDPIEFYNNSKVRIVRIKCGPDYFLTKELLWEYISEWVDNIVTFYQNENSFPDFVTAHYGDGGIAAAMFYEKTNIPYSFTAHSLGAQKMDKLHVNIENIENMEERYHFSNRIIAERIAMANSAFIVTSTSQERDEQYTHFLYNEANCINIVNKYKVIAPGVNIDIFNPTERNEKEDYIGWYVETTLKRDIPKDRLHLPTIISASRLDPKKNIAGLVKAYALNSEVQDLANLVIVLRGIVNPFKDYSNLKEEEIVLMDEIMSLIDQYNLTGKITFLNITSQLMLASTYRYLVNRKSIFALTTVYEPFGLGPIEAMSCGLPAVVTKNGGPKEVLREGTEEFGILVDPFDSNDIALGLIRALTFQTVYKKQALYRVKSKFTWEATAKNYITAIDQVLTNEISYHNMEVPNIFNKNKEIDSDNLDWLKEVYFN